MKLKTKKKNRNEQIFNNFLNYHYQLFLVKDLYKGNQSKIKKIVKIIN